MENIEQLIEYIETFQDEENWSNDVWSIKIAAIRLKEEQNRKVAMLNPPNLDDVMESKPITGTLNHLKRLPDKELSFDLDEDKATFLKAANINQKTKMMNLEWNKITDKQPEYRQGVLAFNLTGNLVIIEYWQQDLKDRVTHWTEKPVKPEEEPGFTEYIDKKGRVVSY